MTETKKKLLLIAAVSLNGVIGKDGTLPWKLKDDLRAFRTVTDGQTVIMGRKTYESIGKPLKNRKNIVLSRSWTDEEVPEGVVRVSSIPEALEQVDEVGIIIGGEDVYAWFIDDVDEMFLTLVSTELEGENLSYFPNWRGNWQCTGRQDFQQNEDNEHEFSIQHWVRVPKEEAVPKLTLPLEAKMMMDIDESAELD